MSEDRTESLVHHLCAFGNSERPAIQTGTLTLSYAQLIKLIDDTGAALRDEGVKAGDRVLVVMPNSIEHIVGALAVIAIGAIAVPLDVDAGSSRRNDAVQQAVPHFCLVCTDLEGPSNVVTIRLRIDPATLKATCCVNDSAIEQQGVVYTHEPIAFIRFTSGSTGHAKGVVLTHAQQLWTARLLSDCFGLDNEHRELMLVSMALSGGWQRVAATLYGGGCVIVAEKPVSVGDMLETLDSFQATGFFTPPPLVRMMLASPVSKVKAALKHCKTIEIGSAAISADELKAFTALAPDSRVYSHYGLTECSRAVILDISAHPERLDTVGKPAPGVEIQIVNEDGQPQATRQDGQIRLRGPQLTSGYWRQPELNQQRFVDGWLATGDYGQIDEEGFLTLRGRHDDLINCGGHCYFPDEVEQALGTLPDIEQFLVAGVPDPRGVLQQVPWAFVVPVNTDEWTPKALLALARSNLPAHMVPRQVVVVERLPLTASGKPDRCETIRLYAQND
ncbi:MAG: acyl--CoA ligase [Thiotrichales bacterium]|nr:MAG: acyl--CoA ligase [Thiotrichales bacterium]